MEYVAGGGVDSFVRNRGPMSPARATEALVRCADAMQAAHDAGVVHRDVKPENLLIAADGNVKLGDFGMALQLHRPRPNEPARAGTPLYTAPEIWNGEAASLETDIYALGATYYFMLTGRVPYETNYLRSLVAAHVKAPVPSISHSDQRASDGCNYIIRKCLAKGPKDRFASARLLGIAAREVLQSLEGEPFELLVKAPREDSIPITQRPTERSLRTVMATASSSDELRPEQWDELLQWAVTKESNVNVLLGERGSGKTTLLGRLMAHRATHGLVFCLDGSTVNAYGLQSSQLEQEIHKNLAAVDANGTPCFDWSLLARADGLSEILFVIDAELKGAKLFESLVEALAALGASINSKIAVSGLPGDKERWQQVAKELPSLKFSYTALPQLSLPRAFDHIRTKAIALQESGQAQLITPDAMLLAAYFGGGNPGRIDEMVDCLLKPGRKSCPRVITSRDVWDVQFSELTKPDASEPRDKDVSKHWPTEKVREILNQCRAICGIPLLG